MNNKGFTLIELMAAIILLAIIMSITAASVVGLINSSKENSYKILVDNIKIGAQAYFEECENVDIIGNTSISCSGYSSSTKTFQFSLNDLLTYGFLKSSATDPSTGEKIVENPKNSANIGSCEIKITKNVDSNYATSYKVEHVSGTNCPTSDEYKN